jgi:hypothetical protein
MRKTVTIKISPEGVTSYETKGYKGQACKEVQQAMLQVGTISCEMPTAEAATPAAMPAYNELQRQ